MPRKGSSRPAARAKAAGGWDSLFESMGRFEIVLLVGAVLLLLVLIYTIQSILSPFVVLGALIFLLYPLRRYALSRNLMWLSIALFTLWLSYTISAILAPFAVSLVLAYLLNPIVSKAQEWKIPRWLTSLVLILVFLGVLILVLFLALPIVVTQFEGILAALSGFFERFREWLWSSRLTALLQRYGVSGDEIRNALSSHLAPRFEDIVKGLLQGMLNVMSSLSHFVTQVFYVILVPFLTFYLMTDYPKVMHRFLMLFPRRKRERVEDFAATADKVFGRYLRGALLVAFMQGVIVTLLFGLYDIKYALLLGMMASLLDLVPYIGLIITMVVSGIVALLSDVGAVDKAILAVVTIGALHLIEITLLSPRIVGKRVGLHPLLVILALLIFSYFLGIVGLLIAVPVTAFIILLVREWEAGRRGIPLGDYHSSDFGP